MATQTVTELFEKDLYRPSNTESAVRDIYLAAFLMALDYRLEYAKSDGYQAEFSFSGVPSGVILQYYNNAAVPELTAKKLFDAFQNARRVSRQVRVISTAPVVDAQELGDQE